MWPRRLGCLTMIVLSLALLQVAPLWQGGEPAASPPHMGDRAVERRWRCEGLVRLGATSETPAGQIAVVVGMRQDTVRTLWGEPVEVRKVRTCFGTAEEWVYRGDPQRYGASERLLHFDEDEVLIEIK